MKKLKVSEKMLLESVKIWTLTHAEPTQGWPGSYTLVWRAPDFYGKIGCIIKSKKRPSKKRVQAALKQELLSRFKSPLRCDGKRVAYSYLESIGKTIPVSNVKQAAKLASDQLYDLDQKLVGEFFSNDPPRLFTCSTHGWILGELAEIRILVSAMRAQINEDL